MADFMSGQKIYQDLIHLFEPETKGAIKNYRMCQKDTGANFKRLPKTKGRNM